MTSVIAMPAAGEMGAGIGRVLTEAGFRVLTRLEGRSQRTRERAAAAGMEDGDTAALAAADIVLSVVPPGIAEAEAEALAARFPAGGGPLFVDLNAIAPDLTRRIGATVEAAGGRFVDGGIIGGPPAPGRRQPRLYVSGPHDGALEPLRAAGLDIRAMGGAIGEASALKMCYAGITKGLTGLQSAVFLAAERHGIGAVLGAELADSQAALLTRAGSDLPRMYPKAYRWVAEMSEIARFVGPEHPESAIWEALAGLYDRLSGPEAARELAALDAFLGRKE